LAIKLFHGSTIANGIEKRECLAVFLSQFCVIPRLRVFGLTLKFEGEDFEFQNVSSLDTRLSSFLAMMMRFEKQYLYHCFSASGPCEDIRYKGGKRKPTKTSWQKLIRSGLKRFAKRRADM